jgi:hypothetical protein
MKGGRMMKDKNGFAKNLVKAAMEQKSYASLEEMFADLLPDIEHADEDELYSSPAGVFEKPRRDGCLMCGSKLQLSECPNGCTESDNYGFMKGFYFGCDDGEDKLDDDWDDGEYEL